MNGYLLFVQILLRLVLIHSWKWKPSCNNQFCKQEKQSSYEKWRTVKIWGVVSQNGGYWDNRPLVSPHVWCFKLFCSHSVSPWGSGLRYTSRYLWPYNQLLNKNYKLDPYGLFLGVFPYRIWSFQPVCISECCFLSQVRNWWEKMSGFVQDSRAVAMAMSSTLQLSVSGLFFGLFEEPRRGLGLYWVFRNLLLMVIFSHFISCLSSAATSVHWVCECTGCFRSDSRVLPHHDPGTKPQLPFSAGSQSVPPPTPPSSLYLLAPAQVHLGSRTRRKHRRISTPRLELACRECCKIVHQSLRRVFSCSIPLHILQHIITSPSSSESEITVIAAQYGCHYV